jgi:PAS domain-containing protein
VSASRKAQRLLAAAEHRLRTILESLTDSFFLLDNEWRFAFLNPAEKSLARPASEVTGRIIWEVYPYLIGTVLEAILGALWQSKWRFPLKNLQPQRSLV